MSKNIFKISLTCLALISAGVSAMPEKQIGEQTLIASEVMQQISDNRNVIYVNMRDVVANNLTSKHQILSFNEIESDIISHGKKYLLDYTSIENKIEKDEARSLVKQVFGISFNSDLVAITEYKGKLSFSPFASSESPLIKELDSAFDTLKSVRQKVSQLTQTTTSGAVIPIKTYFIRTSRPITRDDCSFRLQTIDPRYIDRGNICSNDAHISLNYKVSFFRSKQVSNATSTTPDNKLVRVTLDSDAGAGIRLNHTFGEYYHARRLPYIGDWRAEYLSSALAQYYDFSVTASNSKAHLMQSTPQNNRNTDYTEVELSRFTIGASAKGTADPKGIGAEAGVSGSYTEESRLSYSTADYQIIRKPYSAQSIGFEWRRQKYATVDSLRNIDTSTIFELYYPLDTSRVNPIGYAGFVPNFDVVFGATPEETGKTTFTLAASVGIRPSYSRVRHDGILHSYYHSQEDASTPRRITDTRTFDVDWDAAVFSGHFPANLQLGGTHNNLCLQVNTSKTITTTACNDMSEQQSFIFDQQRYKSVNYPTYCLDTTQITQLKRCDSSRSQLWLWRKEGNIYTDLLTSTDGNGNPVALTHDSSGGLSVSTADENDSNQQMLTSFTTVF